MNIIILAIYHENMDENLQSIIDLLNDIFFIYCSEFIVKIIAYDVQYFKSKWNWLDLLVLLGGFTEYSLQSLYTEAWTLLRVFRIFRILKIFQSFHVFRVFDRLITTISKALPALIAVGFLLFLTNFVYATIGMALFSYLPYNEFINYNVNFDYFGIAMFTMFRAATGESWNGIMHECMYRGKLCISTETNNCGSYFVYHNELPLCHIITMVNSTI